MIQYTDQSKREALEHADWLSKYAKDHSETAMLGALAYFLRKAEAELADIKERNEAQGMVSHVQSEWAKDAATRDNKLAAQSEQMGRMREALCFLRNLVSEVNWPMIDAALAPAQPAPEPCEGIKKGLRCSPCVNAKRTCQPEGVVPPRRPSRRRIVMSDELKPSDEEIKKALDAVALYGQVRYPVGADRTHLCQAAVVLAVAWNTRLPSDDGALRASVWREAAEGVQKFLVSDGEMMKFRTAVAFWLQRQAALSAPSPEPAKKFGPCPNECGHDDSSWCVPPAPAADAKEG